MLVIKRFSERKKVFRERKKTRKIHAKREDELVVVVVKVVHECRMVAKEIEDGLLEEIEVGHFGKEQDIDGGNEDDNENKLVMVNEEG
ncbi:hypothetical protein Tco_0282571 [Tanacetum coccineum]